MNPVFKGRRDFDIYVRSKNQVSAILLENTIFSKIKKSTHELFKVQWSAYRFLRYPGNRNGYPVIKQLTNNNIKKWEKNCENMMERSTLNRIWVEPEQCTCNFLLAKSSQSLNILRALMTCDFLLFLKIDFLMKRAYTSSVEAKTTELLHSLTANDSLSCGKNVCRIVLTQLGLPLKTRTSNGTLSVRKIKLLFPNAASNTPLVKSKFHSYWLWKKHNKNGIETEYCFAVFPLV